MAADSSSLHNPSKPQKHHQSASPLPSFIYKAAFVCVLFAILPISPSGTSEPPSSSTNKTVLARGLELLRLLLAGVAISYGLFSRRNSDHHHPELDKEAATPRSYVSRALHVPSVFDDVGAVDGTRTQTWNYSRNNPGKPLVMAAKESGGANGRDAMSLKSVAEGDRVGKEDVVLPSPIPWRSRSSGRMEMKEEPTPASAPKSFQKSSAPPPPPPPPQPLGRHRYRLGVEKKDEVEHSSNGSGPFGGRSVRTVRPPTLPRNESAKINELRAKMAIESDSEEEEEEEEEEDDSESESSDAEVLPSSASVERAGTEEENEVDRKADEFIAKFREQIRLQRIASLKRLTEQRRQNDS